MISEGLGGPRPNIFAAVPRLQPQAVLKRLQCTLQTPSVNGLGILCAVKGHSAQGNSQVARFFATALMVQKNQRKCLRSRSSRCFGNNGTMVMHCAQEFARANSAIFRRRGSLRSSRAVPLKNVPDFGRHVLETLCISHARQKCSLRLKLS
jgi:hypothetical protein